jgi:hypothetical protein
MSADRFRWWTLWPTRRSRSPDVLEPAETAPLFEALGHSSGGVRTSAFEALTRLPLAPSDWIRVDAYVASVLDSSDSMSERLAVIDAAPWIPMRSVRERVARLAAEGEGEEQSHSELALAELSRAVTRRAFRRESLLYPSWAEGEPPGFAVYSAPRMAAARAALSRLDLWRVLPEPFSSLYHGEQSDESTRLQVHPELVPAAVSVLFQEALATGRGIGAWCNEIVEWVETMQGVFRPHLEGLFATYARQAASFFARTPDPVGFALWDDEGGPRSFCYQIGWTVSRGGLRGLVPGLAAHLASANREERMAAAYLIADAAAYVLRWDAPVFGGGSGPGRGPTPDMLIDDSQVGRGVSREGVEAEELSVEPPQSPSAPPRRFLNVCFVRAPGDQPLGWERTLEAGRDYLLRLDIGIQRPESIVEDVERYPFPVEHLPAVKDGYWLEIVISGDGFRVQTPKRQLFLPTIGPSWVCPCTPGTEHHCSEGDRQEFLYVPVRLKRRTRSARLVVGIYYRKNLIQSVTITAGEFRGPAAVVDYSLSSDLVALDRFAQRSLNVSTRSYGDGSHWLIINGRDPIVLRISEGQMDQAVQGARAGLRQVHFREFGGQLGSVVQRENLYDAANRKRPEVLLTDLQLLAPLGWTLWSRLLAAAPTRMKSLREEMRAPSAIQVCRAGGTNFVFPWALVYDIPLEMDARHHRPCRLLTDWNGCPPLLGATCPYEDDHGLNVICPYGFWGFRHLIEEPASPPGRNLTDEITADPPPAELVVGRSLNLQATLASQHLDELRSLSALHSTDCLTLSSVKEALRPPALHIVYLYTHGLRRSVLGVAKSPAVEIGKGELLYSQDLSAWFLEWSEDHWAQVSPLVFINGCHTAELEVDALVSFVDAFTILGAAGVLGTEITIHQQVANEVAERFFRHLQDDEGNAVGEALRRTRLDLLGKGNLMGLAYTPFCSLSLRLAVKGPAQ